MGCGASSEEPNPNGPSAVRQQNLLNSAPAQPQQQQMVMQMQPNGMMMMVPAQQQGYPQQQQQPASPPVQPKWLKEGTVVMLQNLQQAVQFNGKQGLVQSIVQVNNNQGQQEARYRVQMVDGNILDMAPRNVQVLEEAQYNDDVKLMKKFCPGKVVTLTGLVRDTLLNGQRGMVLGGPHAHLGGRFTCLMHHGHKVDMLPKNIVEFSIPTWPMQKRMAIAGMRSNTELNGTHCRLLEPVNADLRYKVALEDDDGNPDNDTILFVAPYNLLDVEFLPGQRVQLKGLISDKSLNGAIGNILWGPFDNGRYSVNIENAGALVQLLLRPQNLGPAAEGQEAIAVAYEAHAPVAEEKVQASAPPPRALTVKNASGQEDVENVHKQIMDQMGTTEANIAAQEAQNAAQQSSNIAKALEMRRQQRAMKAAQASAAMNAAD